MSQAVATFHRAESGSRRARRNCLPRAVDHEMEMIMLKSVVALMALLAVTFATAPAQAFGPKEVPTIDGPGL
jgi:hypothetical protein